LVADPSVRNATATNSNAESQTDALPETDNGTIAVLANGTIQHNATASPPPMEINLCPDNDFDGRCGVQTSTVVNRCPDNDHNYTCEWYKATDGVWYPQGEGPTTNVVNTTAATAIVPAVTTPAPMAQLGPLQIQVTHREASNSNNNDNDNDDNDNDNDNDDNLPPCSPSTIYRSCADTDYDEDESGDSNPDREEETANCGGEPCTPTEKEDSWTDEQVEEEEESNDEEEDDEDDSDSGGDTGSDGGDVFG
jgi:hypothetical protein